MATSSSRKAEADRETKSDRMELRVTPSAKALIRRAMTLSGLTAGDMAYEGARRILDEHDRLVLVSADRDAFLEAVANPPKPTKALVEAARRYSETYG
jgi:uncharacterized protein (DUF1778 family)